MKKLFFVILLIIFSGFVMNKPAYFLYDKSGKEAKYPKMILSLVKADVVFVGEFHDNPISHWLELQVSKDLYATKKQDLILGAEMFERDDQLVINEYLQGLIKEGNFEKEAKLWDNYQTDYKPLLNFAKDQKLAFLATNVPRRYASAVATTGLKALDNITAEAKTYIAPMPLEVDLFQPTYQAMAKMTTTHGSGNTENIIFAQALKDATMAYTIAQNSQKGKLILHFNGSYHTDKFEGIITYLKKYNPKLSIMTITTVQQDNVEKLNAENKGIADFIICVPSDMTKTY